MTGLLIHTVFAIAVNVIVVCVWIVLRRNVTDVPFFLTHVKEAKEANFWPIYVLMCWAMILVVHGIYEVANIPHQRRMRMERRLWPVPIVEQEMSSTLGLGIGGDGPSWLAVMYTDMVDPARRNGHAFNRKWGEALTQHRDDVRSYLPELDGAVLGSQGSSFLLRFPSPDAALACAIKTQRNWWLTREEKVVPAIRIGIHAGEVTDDEYVAYRELVDMASHVTGAAAPYEILVTEEVVDHLTTEVGLVDLGLVPLHGTDEEHRLYGVIWFDTPAGVPTSTTLAAAEQQAVAEPSGEDDETTIDESTTVEWVSEAPVVDRAKPMSLFARAGVAAPAEGPGDDVLVEALESPVLTPDDDPVP